MKSKNRNYYSEVISTIQEIDFCDPNEIVKIIFEIARTNPSVLTKAFNAVKTNQEEYLSTMDRELLFIGRSNLVTAVKRCRELTGRGLKESKDYVEKLLYNNPE